ncbi:ead/Ea22-like family protein [Escherichia marmotae]|nr:ead/Ea22-like family protein [Escherichia marmotae]MEC9799705.1 ead/Ea22-like family protein [Escherichia marmotae]MED9300688.1 ead/Ea22-like family protein [Escherichia marmotae]MED9383952.1 ead/Ea22-like family protein [Escherichia marmotae]
MSKIDYQALRAKAEKATCGEWSLEYGEGRFDGDDALIHREVAGYIPICRIEGAHPESRFYEDFQMEQQANAEFIAAANPATVLALLDERERNQQYIKRRDQENEDIALTVGKLRVELEAAEKRNAKLQSENAYIRNRYKELDLLIGKNILVMQAAIIEWQSTGDAKSGLAWIYNTLFGPGELPDESEKDAQAYFNRKYAPIDEKLMELHKWFWEQSEAERAAGIRIKGDAGEQNDEKP